MSRSGVLVRAINGGRWSRPGIRLRRRIEAKLAANAESRRAVVAQVLSYAGYLQGLDPAQLKTQVLAGKLPPPATSVLGAVQEGDQQHTRSTSTSSPSPPTTWAVRRCWA